MQVTKKLQAGFTLIELMIVVAIIGILASIAVPQYQDFINKSVFKEVVSATGGDRKVSVELCFQESGDLTKCVPGYSGRLGKIGANAGAIDFDPSATSPVDDVASIVIASGVITATTTTTTDRYGSKGKGVTYILSPKAVGGSLNWDISGTAIDNGLADSK